MLQADVSLVAAVSLWKLRPEFVAQCANNSTLKCTSLYTVLHY